jgi:hypothetical protein
MLSFGDGRRLVAGTGFHESKTARSNAVVSLSGEGRIANYGALVREKVPKLFDANRELPIESG